MKIDLDILSDIIFDESNIYPHGIETTENESGEKFTIVWGNEIPAHNSRYLLVTDISGKIYKYKVTLLFTEGKLVKCE